MAGNVYSKNIRRTIWGSFGRYMAILCIIALGVGFFAGVKNTKGSMMETCDKYVTQYKLFDYRLLSTYGFTEEEVADMDAVPQVKAAEGSITADFFSVDGEGDSIILRAHSITEDVNNVDLIAGRMPQRDNECVADDFFYSKRDIGKTIKVTDENSKKTKKNLEYDEYEIVGIAKSPYYLNKMERGTTSLGDGLVTAFLFMPRGGLTSEYFTEMFVVCQKQGFIFSEEYEANIDAAEEPVTEAAETGAGERYDEIIAEAQEEIDDAQEKIDDGQEEIDDAQRELDDGRATLTKEKRDAYAELADAKSTLEKNQKELVDGKKELKKNKKSLTKQRAELSTKLTEAEQGLAGAMQMGAPVETIAELEGAVSQLEAGISQIDAGLKKIAKQEKTIAKGEKKIEDGYEEYRSGKAEADREFAKAEAELADGEVKLADAREELADARVELADAREELKDIEKPEIIVQTRDDNMGFGSFESNADIVDSIAKVFPVFFFLIAALVCSTTMSRMIEEERTQIGALRALGYTSGKIMLKYMIYAGSAAVIGCIAGFFAGSKYFPMAIWIAYGMMLGFAPLEFYFSWPLAIISVVVSLICSMGTTYFACRGQLRNMPAEILRPRAPKAGKRVFLEQIPFLWERMRFLHKVSARNILRYKKRMVMMVAGIGGCAALVLAGFGIDDSVAGIGDHQYSKIEKYDLTVAFSEEVTPKMRHAFETAYDEEMKRMALLQQTSVTIRGPKTAKSSSLMISDDAAITKAVSFRQAKDEVTKIPYPKEGEAVINNKLAEMLGVKEGGTVTLEYDDTKAVDLTVSGIYRNYVSNYIFINDRTYENVMKKQYEPTMAYVTVKDEQDIYEAAEAINKFDEVIGISINEDVKAGVDEMMVSLNYIVVLVICCAGALAFIVLFNLSNINITEREREIATIEVLGFYPREMGSYVFRENLILVIMGIIAGLPTGFVLHKFIMTKISVDAVAFNEIIDPSSYVYTVITVLCFALVVDVIMRGKLRKINMAEALKSIE